MTDPKRDPKKDPGDGLVKKDVDPDQIASWITSCRAGDRNALAQLQSQDGTGAVLIDRALTGLYDLAGSIEQQLIEGIHPQDLLGQESVRRQVAVLRAELVGPEPSPLECLLVDRIIVNWLEVKKMDRFMAQFQETSFKQGEYYQRRHERAEKRFHQACKSLAQIRRLQGPMVQLNVADKQINVVAPGAGMPKPR
jgi:hypothetical protein